VVVGYGKNDNGISTGRSSTPMENNGVMEEVSVSQGTLNGTGLVARMEFLKSLHTWVLDIGHRKITNLSLKNQI